MPINPQIRPNLQGRFLSLLDASKVSANGLKWKINLFYGLFLHTQWLATCARKPKVPGSSLAASYV